MYRIHFSPQVGKFVVQVLWIGSVWRTVRQHEASGPSTELTFRTYSEAKTHVSEIGLDQLYSNKSADKYRAHMQGAMA